MTFRGFMFIIRIDVFVTMRLRNSQNFIIEEVDRHEDDIPAKKETQIQSSWF